MRHEIGELIHDVDAKLAIRDSHMDVHAEYEQPLGNDLHRCEQCLVAVFLGNELILPSGKRMSTGGDDAATVSFGGFRNQTAQTSHLLPRFSNIAADVASDLYLGLQKLGLHLVPKDGRPLFEYVSHEGSELPALSIDDLVLFFDA